jgi:ABC-2 type transport system permease protein
VPLVATTDTAVGSTSTRRLPGAFAACFLYAVRVCVPPKRWLLLTIPIVAAALFGLLARTVEDSGNAEGLATVSNALFGLVLPFATLVVGDAVLGAEVRSGAFALTWLSPTPFSTIVLARWLAGWAVAAVSLAPAMVVAALVAGVSDGAGPLALSAVAASGAYIAIFVLIGALVRRGALWSLAFVLLIERLLGTALDGIAQLSPQWLARNVYADLGPEADDLLRSGVPDGTAAIVRLAIVTAVTLAVGVWRVRHIKFAGSAE